MSQKTARRARPLSEKSKKAAALYVAAVEGNRRAQFALSESIAVGDFAVPFEPILQAQVTKVFHETFSNVEQWTTPKTVQGIDRDEPVSTIVISDADQANIPATNRGDTWVPGTLPSVGPREKYPEIGLASFNAKTIRAGKIGEAFAIDWEAIVNSRGGEVDLIDQATTAFGKHAKQSADVIAMKRLVKSTGFSDAVVAQGQVVPGNPDFSDLKAFVDALNAILLQPVVIDGNEVVYDSFVMLVAPHMKALYDQMLNATAFQRVPARTGTSSEDPGLVYSINVAVPVNITVVESKWIRTLWPTVGKGYIMLPVGEGTYPVLTLNTLQGFPEPSVWVKDANARNLGGGDVDVLSQGDFDSDAIETKVRHVLGSNLLWGNGILFSTGTNT